MGSVLVEPSLLSSPGTIGKAPIPPVEPDVASLIPGQMVYAVRSNGQGVVFTNYEQARGMYHQLQSLGLSPSLASSPSLTDGVSFVEGFAIRGTSAEAVRRRDWINEEYAAHQRRLLEGWADGEGVEPWWSESDDLSDESDISTDWEE